MSVWLRKASAIKYKWWKWLLVFAPNFFLQDKSIFAWKLKFYELSLKWQIAYTRLKNHVNEWEEKRNLQHSWAAMPV